MKEKVLIIILLGILVIPSIALSAVPIFEIDMDPSVPGIQTNILLTPGDTFTTDVVVTLPDNTSTLSSFSYSVRWDNVEIMLPSMSDVTTYILDSEWLDQECQRIYIENFLIANCVQLNFNYSEGPLTAVVATITWTSDNPLTDNVSDIEVGFFDPLDMAYDKDSVSIIPNFHSGEVDFCLEPVSISRITPVYFDSFQDAYDNAVTDEIIKSQDAILVENLIFDSNISITIDAGYDCEYISNAGMTTINGDMIISDGKVIIERGILEVK